MNNITEVPHLSNTSFKSWIQKTNVKAVLKWTTVTLLLLVILGIILSLIEELHDVYTPLSDKKDDANDIREWQVSIWSSHTLYLAYVLLAIYATVKEKYPLLLSYAVVDLILDFIYIFDCEGVFIYLFEISVTMICFITAIYYKYNQNAPWNPF